MNKDLSFSNISLKDGEDESLFIVSMFSCKDVNRIPLKTFNSIKKMFVDVLNYDEQNAEVFSMLISQSLSVNNQLVVNVNDPELSPKDIIEFGRKKGITLDYIVNDLIKDYKLHWIVNTKKEKFLKSIADLTNNQELLTSAASFIHYHCINNISDDDVVHRDTSLANLIRLCTLDGIYKELKIILKEQFDIDKIVLDALIVNHLDLIFGA